jgi:3-keto-5-aminohexanoate cleavage enzyme
LVVFKTARDVLRFRRFFEFIICFRDSIIAELICQYGFRILFDKPRQLVYTGIMKDLIICVAPFPGEKQEEKFPGKMNVAQEVIDSHNAGASIAHLHVRDERGLQTTDTALFERTVQTIRSHCPIIIEGSTGGAPEHTLEQRCVSFTVPGVEMGSLNLGSVNLWDGVYSNKLSDILFYARELNKRALTPFLDCFDLSHFHCLPRLISERLISPPCTFGLVFDVPNALPYQDRYLDYFLRELPERSHWFLVRHHARGSEAFARALELGGHIRVGYEDGPFLSDGSRARSNARLVEEVATAAEKSGRTVVGPERTRELLGMKKTGRR